MADVAVVLASASPRRRQLLARAGVAFDVRVAPVNEQLDANLAKDPQAACAALAQRKAGAVVDQLLREGVARTTVVLGSDTMVVLDGAIFGKPADHDHAASMLSALSGNTHQVMTSVCAWKVEPAEAGAASAGAHCFVDVTNVTFKRLSPQDVGDYLAKGESADKAGAYAIQGHGAALVERVDGAMDTVIGLPVGRMRQELPFLFC